MKADASECLAHAPVAWRIACKVLAQRQELMKPMGKKKHMKEMALSAPLACAGRSLVEMMEDELDEVVSEMMSWPADQTDGEKIEYATLRGEALGMATCIALIRQPYNPDIDAVREAAMERYNGEVDEEPVER